MEAINKLKAFSKPINFLSFSGGIRDICFVLCYMEEGGEIFEKKISSWFSFSIVKFNFYPSTFQVL